MEETLKSLQISPRIKAKWLNATWDIMLANECEKELASSVLTTKAARLQTEYMHTRRTTVTLHRVPMDLSEERLEAFSCKIWTVISNAGIDNTDNNDSEDLSLDTPDTLTC